MSDREQSITETDAMLVDEIVQEPAQAEGSTKKGDTTHQWNIVVTLVVPIHLDPALWPPSEEWTTGPWPDDERSGRTSEDRRRTYGNEALASPLQDEDRRCHKVYTNEDKHVGKFKVECVELVMPDRRTQWGLVHLSIKDLAPTYLRARANDLYRYLRLQQDPHIRKGERGGITEITELLYPAQSDVSTGSRASAVILLLGDPVTPEEGGNQLARALHIDPRLTFAEGTLLDPIRQATAGLHGILIESSTRGADKIQWHVQGSYAEQVLIARSQKEAVKGFVGKVATLFDEGAGIKADELVREFYRWRAKFWWTDVSTEATATEFLQTYQTALRLPEMVDQLSGEMADYAAIAQEDAANAAAQSSYLFAVTATIFTIFSVPATIGFTGAEILGWHGVVGFLGALGITAVGSSLLFELLWRRLSHLRNGYHFRYKRHAVVDERHGY